MDEERSERERMKERGPYAIAMYPTLPLDTTSGSVVVQCQQRVSQRVEKAASSTSRQSMGTTLMEDT